MLFYFPWDVLDGILDFIESISEGFTSSCLNFVYLYFGIIFKF